jgi:formylglycine-generating enzyme required for sulfatase activity
VDEEHLFTRALAIASPGERGTFLSDACGGDPGLRARVEELLRLHDAAGDFLESPPDSLLTDRTEILSGDTRESGVAAQRDDARTIAGGLTDQLSSGLLAPSSAEGTLGRIGPYDVLSVVGRGGMGIVLKAHDAKLNRFVAIKVLAPALAADAAARKRFLREARAAAAIAHPNVVTIHSVDDDALPWLVMEFVEGVSLGEALQHAGPLPVPEIARIGSEIAAGLAAAHKHGLIHRDIKPANILLEDGTRRVRITDFGLARAADDGSVTRPGDLAGTPQFMSPEQARGEPISHRSDLFSLGSVLYALCTGQPPFQGDNALSVMRLVTDATPAPIHDANPGVPEWLCGIVARLIAKDPAERFPSAQEVSDLLGRRLAELRHAAQAEAQPTPARPGVTDRWRWWAVGALTTVVALAGLIIYITHEDGTVTEHSGIKVDVRPATAAPRHAWPADLPAPAIVPFAAAQARAHQEAWARHFGLPVEFTNSLGMQFRLVPPGEFRRGSTPDEIDALLPIVDPTDEFWEVALKSEAPPHTVILTQPFYVAIHEVTQRDYADVTGATPSFFSATGPGRQAVANLDTNRHPVELVNWNQATDFCNRVSAREQLQAAYEWVGDDLVARPNAGYRLPTEAEWEFACRAGTTTRYATGDSGDDLRHVAWYQWSAGGRTHPVGELQANAFGLHDMLGNVWEWCQDGWDNAAFVEYLDRDAVDPTGPSLPQPMHVFKGGNWRNSALGCRSAARGAMGRARSESRVGFRVLLPVDAVRQMTRDGSQPAP